MISMPSIAHLGLAPRELGDRDLPALIHRASEPVVVESYFAGWDRPWRGLSAAAWHELLHEFGERVNGAVIESGASRELALRFGLEIIPTVLVFSGGEVVARFSGNVQVAEVVAAVRGALAQARALEADRRELEAFGGDVREARVALTPARTVLRYRASEAPEPSFAHAG